MEKLIALAVIEDMEPVRESLVYAFEPIKDIQVLFDGESVESFLEHMEGPDRVDYDVMLLDIGLPGISGIDALPQLREKFPNMDIIMLTAFDEQRIILKALCSGAVGYIGKRTHKPEIIEGVRVVNGGGSYMSPEIAREIVQHLVGSTENRSNSILSDRQLEILGQLSKGLSYAEIGEALFISAETVKSHLKRIYRELQVNNRSQAIALYLSGSV